MGPSVLALSLAVGLLVSAGACGDTFTTETEPTGGAGGTGGSGGACPHDVCVVGHHLSADCGECEASVCSAQPYCCTDRWDWHCVQQAKSLCPDEQCPESACVNPFPAAPGGDCPSQCTSCSLGECEIECIGGNACIHGTIDCPPGFDCTVLCDGDDACVDTTINCPQDYTCVVRCTGPWACAQASIHCGFGPCELRCDYTNTTMTCGNTQLNCGVERCAQLCNGVVDTPPSMQCPAACACANQCEP